VQRPLCAPFAAPAGQAGQEGSPQHQVQKEGEALGGQLCASSSCWVAPELNATAFAPQAGMEQAPGPKRRKKVRPLPLGSCPPARPR
jgi:hypothetical protein